MGDQALHHQLVQGVQQGSSIVIGVLIVLLQEADGPVVDWQSCQLPRCQGSACPSICAGHQRLFYETILGRNSACVACMLQVSPGASDLFLRSEHQAQHRAPVGSMCSSTALTHRFRRGACVCYACLCLVEGHHTCRATSQLPCHALPKLLHQRLGGVMAQHLQPNSAATSEWRHVIALL